MLAASLISLAACQQEPAAPEGQVVAVVNGEEITSSELQAEAEATGADLRKPEVRNRLLDGVIQRHLQAAAATERGLDKDPRFLAQRRRAEQHILAQMYLLAARAGAEDPDVQQARMFVLRNPKLFEERELMVVDRVGFAPARAVTRAEVEAIQTLPEAEQLLRRKGARFDRQATTIDPADLPAHISSKLLNLKLGEVFYATQDDSGMFASVLERRPSPVPIAEQLGRAKAILKRQKQEQALKAAVENIRKTAKIRYQNGYGPVGGVGRAQPEPAKRQ